MQDLGKVNLLLFTSGKISGSYGGGQIYIQNLLAGFAEQNFPVSIFTFVSGESCVTRSSYYGHTVYEIVGNRQYQNEQARILIQELKPEIIHAHGAKELALDLGKEYSIPCVVTAHHGGIICPGGALLNCCDEICNDAVSDRNCLRCVCRNIPGGYWFWYFLLRSIPLSLRIKLADFFAKRRFILFLTPVFTATSIIQSKLRIIEKLRSADLILSPCQRMFDIFKWNGVRENITIFPHCIPELKRSPLPEIKDKIRFFFIGRICYVKGVHVMLEAFRKLPQETYELHIIGEGANKGEKSYCNKLHSQYSKLSVVWHGKLPHDRITEVIEQCHVMIHPAICLEIFGLTIAESLSIGRPVLATRCGGAEMQIKDGINGWLIPPNDVNAMRNKLEDIIESKSKIYSVAEYKNNYDFKDYLQSLMIVYKKNSRIKDNLKLNSEGEK